MIFSNNNLLRNNSAKIFPRRGGWGGGRERQGRLSGLPHVKKQQMFNNRIHQRCSAIERLSACWNQWVTLPPFPIDFNTPFKKHSGILIITSFAYAGKRQFNQFLCM